MTAADRRKLNKDAGFSLLELLIATVILAIIVIPLLNLFLSSNRINIKSRQTLRATTAAQDIMEGLKAYNITEIKEQFDKPADGFYVIDSRLIKGDVKEEDALEKDPSGNPIKGLYVFSMEDLNLQGSRFDAMIRVDGTGYMPGTTTHDNEFNDAAMADARSIDKKNGTFVETDKIRQAIMTGVVRNSEMNSIFKDSAMETTIKGKLDRIGILNIAPEYELDKAYQDLKNAQKPDGLSFKGSPAFFDHVSRTMTIELTDSAEVDKNGLHKVDMKVTDTYAFELKNAGGDLKKVESSGFMGLDLVQNKDCGSITRMVEKEKDPATGADVDVEKINVNIFYYPLYGASTSDGSVPEKITIINKTGDPSISGAKRAKLNLLIAKMRYEDANPEIDPLTGLPKMDAPEYFTDSQMAAAEISYSAVIEIKSGSGAPLGTGDFTLKTNLGLNLVGEKYLGAGMIDCPSQLRINGILMDLSGTSGMDIYTLDGVRSPMGNPATVGEATELIYDVEVSVYEEGAAAEGFPIEKRMVVIEGSMTN